MSYRLLGEIEGERKLISAANEVWLYFRIDEDMPSSGTDDEKGYSWRAEEASVPVDEYEFHYRKVTVTLGDGRSTVIYVNP